jgi:hypothetical protein
MVHQPRQRSYRSPVFALALSLLGAVVAAPARADVTDTQQWTQVTLQKELTDRWRAYFEVQPRFGKDVDGLERMIIRPAIGYRLNPKLSVWQGYGYTPQFEPEDLYEHRLFQQLLFEDRRGKTAFTSRTRLEERFIEGAGGTAVRLRTMLRLMHPVSADQRWAVVGYEEVFWNLTSTSNGPVSGFDQNRLFLGVSRQVSKELRVETGYLLNHINTPRTSSNRRLDAWVVWLAVGL